MTINESPKNKKKGPIRFEAIIPIAIIFTLTGFYFSYYFDSHLKSLIEYVGTQANGAEVNVKSIRTSFLRGSFNLNNLEVTNKETPRLNSLEIEEINFKFLWDALLRMKFVVEDASINNIQIQSPRKNPGKVLPPEPAKPSKLTEIQDQVFAQIKNKYGGNILGDAITLLEGGNIGDQITEIKDSLQSETRVNQMIAEIKDKKQSWDKKIKELSDTSVLKSIEIQVKNISKEKNFLKQIQEAKKVADDFKKIENQYQNIQSASKELKLEVTKVSAYPEEIQNLVKQDIDSLKNRFSIPQVDFKDMAMHLFAGQFANYIAKARKYQAIAKQYIPEKKEQEEIIPPRRAEGKTYQFPITTSYPLFWLKRAAISSKGNANSYAGDLSGELTNVTTDPKFIKQPVQLDLRGNFPASKIMGVKTIITLDHTRIPARQKALIEVQSFVVPEKIFVNENQIKFGLQNSMAKTKFLAEIVEEKVDLNWESTLMKPNFLVEAKSSLVKEIFTNILTNISYVSINASATGTFSQLNVNMNSNLGDELSQGFSREIGAKVAQAQNKINELIDTKIKAPQEQLRSLISANAQNLNNISGIQDFYKKNKDRISAEIKKITSGNSKQQIDELKEKGKKLLKGFKF